MSSCLSDEKATYHFLNITNTAATIRPKPKKWFHASFWSLKKMTVNNENMMRVIASCIVFSCTRLKGPPSSTKPARFAGTWKRYSKKASPQLISITAIKERCLPHS